MNYVHDLSPFAIRFWDNFGIRWYGLAYLSGFVFGYYLIVFMNKRSRILLTVEKLPDYVTYMALGVMLGGRLGYILFYAPDLFVAFDSHFPYWGVLKVNEGGMASHGGIAGVMIACYLYSRNHKISFLHVLDLVALGGAVAFFFGRLANFVNGELYGRVVKEPLAWAVKFPQEMIYWTSGELSRISSAVEALGQYKSGDGQVITLNAGVWQSWIANYGDLISRERVHEVVEALIQAVQHGNEAVTSQLAPFLASRHPSQIYQAILEGFLVFVLLMWVWRKPQKPGVIGGWYGVGYSVARIIGEQFRTPDAQIGFQALGLTRGQWLSIGFLVFSIGYLVLSYRRDAPKLGGWMKQRPSAK